MPPPTMDIRMIKDVLRLKLHGRMSHEALARSLCISKGVVANYTALANAAGLVAWEYVAALRQVELERSPSGSRATSSMSRFGMLLEFNTLMPAQ
jgi:hypothetical protein